MSAKIAAPRPERTTRFIAYARSQGFDDPEEALTRDEQRYPGGKMAGFICWISQQWQEWCLLHGKRRTASGFRNDILGPADHDAFDAWLAARTQCTAPIEAPP